MTIRGEASKMFLSVFIHLKVKNGWEKQKQILC